MMRTTLNVLLLAANPEPKNLRLAAEQRLIIQRVEQVERMRQKRSGMVAVPIEFTTVGSARISDLLAALQLVRPDVLHFSGHGAATGDVVVEDDAGGRLLLRPDVLAKMLGEFNHTLKVVFLNACYSQAQAADITRQIDCCIGMRSVIEDPVALEFAATFYQMIASGCSVGTAFRLAQQTAEALPAGQSNGSIPCLTTREDVRADQVFLAPSQADAEAQGTSSSLRLDGHTNALARTSPSALGDFRTRLRNLLNDRLPMDALLTTFLTVKYPRIASQMGENMQRLVKLNILFTYERDMGRLEKNLSDFCTAYHAELPEEV